MHILHICSDFLGTTAHVSLFKELDELSVVQTVFVPLNVNANKNKRTMTFKTEGSKLVFSTRLSKYHRFLYGCKIKHMIKDIEVLVDINEIDLIHSAILCNEGAVAYELNKKYGIPFISAIRNTDLNAYIRVFKWRKPYFTKILKAAKKIIFISAQYPCRVNNVFKCINDKSITDKYLVIHNGLQNYYQKNIFKPKEELHDPIKVVMTGAFVQNKNIHGVVEAIRILRDKGVNIELAAIGNNLTSYASDKGYSESVVSLSAKYSWFTTYEAQPKEQLTMKLRDYDIFVLVSFHETFGLSYLEALSQGLPIVYTLDEGFDKTYPDGSVGYGAYAQEPNSIAIAIEEVIKNRISLKENISNLDLSVYNWTNIAKRYVELYNQILK